MPEALQNSWNRGGWLDKSLKTRFTKGVEERTNPVPDAPQEVVKPASVPSQPKKFKPLWIWVIAAAVVLLVLGISGYFLFFKEKISQKATTEKVYHVGVLSALDFFFPAVDSFKQKMTELEYVEGKNIIYDIQKAPSPVGNQDIVKKFVEDKVDLILVFPTEASIEAKEVTKGTNIPIISIAASVEGNDLIKSIQQPGGNITGVRFPIGEVAAKRLELLHEIAPKAKRIWIPYLKDYPTVASALAAVKPLARSLGLTIIEAPFADPKEVTAYFKKVNVSSGIDAILFVPEPISIIPPYTDQVYAFANTHKIPVVSATVLDGDTGPIFGLIPSNEEFGSLAAPSADKILRGIPVGTIPIVTPESELQINYKVIQKLGLTISEGLLSRATKIVR